MTARAIHWHEGMFLRPHHFQAAQRHWEHLAARNEKWDLHHNWGLRAIDIDLQALANYRFVVRSLQARFRDGTLLALPEDGTLPALDLKGAFGEGNAVTVFLGVPVLHVGRANVAGAPGGEAADGTRYLLDSQDLEDENTGVNPQPIQVRLLHLKLLLSTHDRAGYEVLPLARIQKSPRAEATPELDVTYIPPLLSADAWPPLAAGIAETLYDRIGKKVDLLANQAVAGGLDFNSRAAGDQEILAQLRVLNEAYSVLGVQSFAQGTHPLPLYQELCRVAGQLAIFGPTRRPPDLPRYDHDDLGGCFYRVKQHIDTLLNMVVEPAYKERPFVGAGLRMQVSLEPAWLESVWDMYISADSPLDPEESIRLLTRPGQLDMKVGSSDRVDAIYRMGAAGLRFAHSPHPPRVLPSHPGLIYFQINRESQQAEWQNVQRSLTLAIRLNENLIAGDIQGQRVLTIKTGGQTTTFQFTLYVVAHETR
jgi:type VI secretion system protein ImpJ